MLRCRAGASRPLHLGGGYVECHLSAGWGSGNVANLFPLPHPDMQPTFKFALATAVYTAFLFAQARARDLWQSPLLPPQMAVQTFLAGAGATAPLALAVAPEAVPFVSPTFTAQPPGRIASCPLRFTAASG